MFKSILVALVCAATVFISGCGGGGGGSSGPKRDPVSISVSQQSVAVTATTSDAAPFVGVTITVDHIPTGGLYIRGRYSLHGIASASLNNGGLSEFLTLTFARPSTQGVGVYNDTVTLNVCYDQACTEEVTNSPLLIPVIYTVAAGDPNASSPTLYSLTPSTVFAGGADFVLTLNGAGFNGLPQVYWNGVSRPTFRTSASQITAQIPASDIATAGSNQVTVLNAADPNWSNALTLVVANANLSISRVSPSSITVGNPAFWETVVGTGFDATSTVLWNGVSRPTTFISTTELVAQMSATDVASLATANVSVTRTGSSTSNVKTVSIVAPTTDATAFQINPQHTGSINFANIVPPTAFPLSSKWTASLSGQASYALIAGGRVFVTVWQAGVGETLVALNAATGARLWGPITVPFWGNATYENGRVFVLSYDQSTTPISATLYAFDAASGTQIWSKLFNTQYVYSGPPTAAGGIVYFVGGGSGSTLFAVDEANGDLLWTKAVDGSGSGTPAVTADGVYYSTHCQTIDLRPLTGSQIWGVGRGCGGGGGETSVVANGLVFSPEAADLTFNGMFYDAKTGTYVSSSYLANVLPALGSQMGYFQQYGTLRGINLSSGATQWTFTGDGGLNTAPILVNNYVFAFSNTGNLYGLDATTGSVLWQTNMGGTMTNYSSMPFSGLSAGGGLLLVPVGNSLVAYTLSNNP